MSESKYVFKIVPGKSLNYHDVIDKIYEGEKNDQSRKLISKPYKLAEISFIPLDNKSNEALELPVIFCLNFGLPRFYCIKDEEGNLNGSVLDIKELNRVVLSYTFIYLNDSLIKLSIQNEDPYSDIKVENNYFLAQPMMKYQYITKEDNGKYYFSDREGNIIDSLDNFILQDNISSCSVEEVIQDVILSDMFKDVISLKEFTKVFTNSLTDEQLKTFVSALNDNQLCNSLDLI
jgi:hypothetical protein